MSDQPIRIVDQRRPEARAVHGFLPFAARDPPLHLGIQSWTAGHDPGRDPLVARHACRRNDARRPARVAGALCPLHHPCVGVPACSTAAPYPGFVGDPGYPVDVEIDPPVRQNRAKVAFRILLAVPALLVANGLLNVGGGAGSRSHNSHAFQYSSGGAAVAAAFLAWFACLVRGPMPRGLRDLQTYCLRYCAQTWGYVLLLTDRYPNASPADPPAAQPNVEPTVALEVTDDLARSRLTVFFRLLLALPHVVWILLWTVVVIPTAFVAWLVMVVRGRLPLSLHRFFSAYLRYQAQLGRLRLPRRESVPRLRRRAQAIPSTYISRPSRPTRAGGGRLSASSLPSRSGSSPAVSPQRRSRPR